jgi:hypothetical protein
MTKRYLVLNESVERREKFYKTRDETKRKCLGGGGEFRIHFRVLRKYGKKKNPGRSFIWAIALKTLQGISIFINKICHCLSKEVFRMQNIHK